jgi:hypothetical protein
MKSEETEFRSQNSEIANAREDRPRLSYSVS